MNKQILAIFMMVFTCCLLSSCDNVASKIAKKGASKVESSIAKKAVKELSEEGLEMAGKKAATKALKEMATSNTALSTLYESFSKYISRDFADGVVVKSTKEGLELASKDFPNSAIRMSKNIITGKGGSLVKSGPVNEFLNHLLPNKTYIIDDSFIYKTDDLGRVISCSADRSKAFGKIERNTQRNSDVQKFIVNSLDGKPGLDDAGHLFANNTGGPNELINQVPMSKSLNRNGQWRELERIEEEALKSGKKVSSQRNLLYRGSEKRPYAIEFITKIDGVETKTLIQNID